MIAIASKPSKKRSILFHVIGWMMPISFIFLMMWKGGFNIGIIPFLAMSLPTYLLIIVLFYLNYNILVPKLMLRGKMREFCVLNIILAFVFGLAVHVIDFTLFDLVNTDNISFEHDNNKFYITPHRSPLFAGWEISIFDTFRNLFIVVISAVIKVSEQWFKLEREKNEAQKALADAELQNLRSQLNPHFLLNSLNNIYALISFDEIKAQDAVQELSKLLRHVLYDNQQEKTTLAKEVEFMNSYIELMRIRLSSNVHLETEFNVKKESQTEIAPLIFISLVENAFKHGVSPTEESYINFRMSEDKDTITCEISNSNHPKKAEDKSGSGIGLMQVEKRLELCYHDRHKWTKGLSADGKEYVSKITLYKEKQK